MDLGKSLRAKPVRSCEKGQKTLWFRERRFRDTGQTKEDFQVDLGRGLALNGIGNWPEESGTETEEKEE